MTVAELIRALQQLSPHKLVHIYTDGDYKMVKNVAEYEDIVEILPIENS